MFDTCMQLYRIEFLSRRIAPYNKYNTDFQIISRILGIKIDEWSIKNDATSI